MLWMASRNNILSKNGKREGLLYGKFSFKALPDGSLNKRIKIFAFTDDVIWVTTEVR